MAKLSETSKAAFYNNEKRQVYPLSTATRFELSAKPQTLFSNHPST
jgi:hypothetical protein